MSRASSRPPRSNGRLVLALLLGGLALVTLPTPARAGQDVMTKEAAGAVKAAFVAEIEAMRVKFIGLAEAFPQDKYTWRPMDGVRSVSEVLMLIASEGYGFAPTSLGGQAAMSREESGKLATTTDKAQVIAHLTKAFAHAKQALESNRPGDPGRQTTGHGTGPVDARDCAAGSRRHARASGPAHCLRAHEPHRAPMEQVDNRPP